jgi:hypothetical protein
MKRIILNLIFMAALMLLPAAVFMEPAYACGNTPAAQQVSSGIDETTSNPATCDDTGVNSAISLAVNILSLVVGAAAVIMIVFSGFKYITSGGESGKVSNAKNSLIYALVGLAVAAVAQLLVHLVLSDAVSTATPCPYTISGHPNIAASDPLCQKP